MSLAAYTVAIRNHLRTNLTDFYSTVTEKVRNCKVMVDEVPTASCGQEFIAVYGSAWYPNSQLDHALDEKFGVTVAVSRKIAVIPPDRRGELGYVVPDFGAINGSEEDETFYGAWASTESRCREIVKLL